MAGTRFEHQIDKSRMCVLKREVRSVVAVKPQVDWFQSRDSRCDISANVSKHQAFGRCMHRLRDVLEDGCCEIRLKATRGFWNHNSHQR
jgi:hypothetical protein